MAKTRLVLHSLLLVALFVGLIFIITGLRGKLFSLEIAALALFMVLALSGYLSKRGERVFFIFFSLYALNLILLWYFVGVLYVILLVLSLAGFFLAFPPSAMPPLPLPSKPKESPPEPHSQVFDAPPPEKKTPPEKKVSFSPGKYLASKMGNTYHEPKCEWAKKIAKERRVWFVSKEEAWEKKYKAHGCVR